MKLKFLNKALTGLILSLSCLVSTANAGLILEGSTDVNTSGQTYSEIFDVSGFESYIDLVLTVDARGDYDGSDTNEFIEFLIDDISYGKFYFDTDGVTSEVGPSGTENYDYLMDFSFTINDEDWATLFANDSQVKVEWKNGSDVGSANGYYVNYNLSGTPGQPSVEEPKPVPAPTTLAIFALGMIALGSRRFKKQS